MLNRALISFAVLAMTLALACGGGSKNGDTTPSNGTGGGDNGGGDTNPCGNGGGDTNPCGGGDTMAAGAAGDAAKGAAVFDDSCSSCHGDAGEGAGKNPKVKGDGSLSKFGSDKELWDYVKKEMPKDDPGSLSDEQVADVIAWMKS